MSISHRVSSANRRVRLALTRSRKPNSKRRTLRIEMLERRQLMAANLFNQAAFGSYSYSTGVDISLSNPNAKLLRTDFGGAYRWLPNATAEQEQWQAVTDDIIARDNQNLFVTNAPDPKVNGTAYAQFDPADTSGNTIWMLTVHGVFKSTNFQSSGPVSWTDMRLPVVDSIPRSGQPAGDPYRMDRTNRLMIDPANSNVVYVGTIGHGLWRTLNGGQTWSQIPKTQIPAFNYFVTHQDDSRTEMTTAVSFVSADPTQGTVLVNGVSVSKRLFVGVRGSGVFESNNGGRTFQKISGGANQPQLFNIVPGSTFPKTWNRIHDSVTSSTVDPNGYLYVATLKQENYLAGGGVDDGALGLQQTDILGGSIWRYKNGVWKDITPVLSDNRVIGFQPLDWWRNPVTGKVRLFVSSGGFAAGKQNSGMFYTDDAQAASPVWTDITPDASQTINRLPGQIDEAGHGAASLTVDPADPTGQTVWVTGGWTQYRTQQVTNQDAVWEEVANGHEELFGYDIEVGTNGKLNFLFGDRGGLVANTGDLDGRRHQMWSWTAGKDGKPAGTYSNIRNYTFTSDASATTTLGNPHYMARIADAWGFDGAFNGFSLDGGESWIPFESLPPVEAGQFWNLPYGGQIRASATVRDASYSLVDPATGQIKTVTGKVPTTLLWNTSLTNQFFHSQDNGKSWQKVQGLNDISMTWNLANSIWGNVILADGADGEVFYAVGSWSGAGLNVNNVYANWFYSTDRGVTWQVGSQNGPDGQRVVNDVLGQTNATAVPGQAGAVFLPSQTQGLFFSAAAATQNPGWIQVPGVVRAQSFALGKAAAGRSKPAAFVLGLVRVGTTEKYGIWRSDDILNANGTLNPQATWINMADLNTPITNSGQPIPFSLASYGQSLAADPSIHGRVYLSMKSRGMMYGGIAGAAPSLNNPTAVLDADGLAARLQAIGDDDGGEDNLQYFWRAVSKPVDALEPRFESTNGTNSAKSIRAILSASGSYTFELKATDSGGQRTVKTVSVNVPAVATRIGPTAVGATVVAPGANSQLFLFDQFGKVISSGVQWSVRAGGGRIDSSGRFVAPNTTGTTLVAASHAGVVISDLVDIQTPTIDYAQGFINNPNLSFLTNPNGIGELPQIRADKSLQFTSLRWNGSGIFDQRPMDLRSFATQFQFQFGADRQFGDGLVFVIADQHQRLNQSRSSEGIGYSHSPSDGYPNHMAKSIAIVFDPWAQNPWPKDEAVSQTGLYQGGEPLHGREIDVLGDGIHLNSEDLFEVRIAYDSRLLTVSIINTRTGAVSTQRYPVDIPAVVGQATGFMGFVSSAERTEITRPLTLKNWSAFADPQVAAPRNFVAQTINANSIRLRWTDIANNETGYVIERSTSATFASSIVREVVTAGTTQWTAAGLASNTTYFFRIKGVNPTGESVPVQNSARTSVERSLGIFSVAQDIGAPRRVGSTTFQPAVGRYTVRGGGEDLFGTQDQFHFAQASISGDTIVSARIDSLTPTVWGAKAGVMMRQDNSASSRSVLVNYGVGIGIEMLVRDEVGGFTHSVIVPNIGPPSTTSPIWVRIVRQGDRFIGFYARKMATPTDLEWLRIGERNVAMPSTVLGGLAVTAHSPTTLATANFRFVSLVSSFALTTSNRRRTAGEGWGTWFGENS